MAIDRKNKHLTDLLNPYIIEESETRPGDVFTIITESTMSILNSQNPDEETKNKRAEILEVGIRKYVWNKMENIMESMNYEWKEKYNIDMTVTITAGTNEDDVYLIDFDVEETNHRVSSFGNHPSFGHQIAFGHQHITIGETTIDGETRTGDSEDNSLEENREWIARRNWENMRARTNARNNARDNARTPTEWLRSVEVSNIRAETMRAGTINAADIHRRQDRALRDVEERISRLSQHGSGYPF